VDDTLKLRSDQLLLLRLLAVVSEGTWDKGLDGCKDGATSQSRWLTTAISTLWLYATTENPPHTY